MTSLFIGAPSSGMLVHATYRREGACEPQIRRGVRHRCWSERARTLTAWERGVHLRAFMLTQNMIVGVPVSSRFGWDERHRRDPRLAIPAQPVKDLDRVDRQQGCVGRWVASRPPK